jgi:hypothetical protein
MPRIAVMLISATIRPERRSIIPGRTASSAWIHPKIVDAHDLLDLLDVQFLDQVEAADAGAGESGFPQAQLVGQVADCRAQRFAIADVNGGDGRPKASLAEFLVQTLQTDLSRSIKARRAPARPSSRERARPIPLAAPVTTATRSRKSIFVRNRAISVRTQNRLRNRCAGGVRG